jgi:hypothetical protein
LKPPLYTNVAARLECPLWRKIEVPHPASSAVFAIETPVCTPKSVQIVISEVPKDAWARAGKLKSGG